MQRLFICVLLISCLTLISGCHSDAEQSAEIQTKMEDAISYEEDFKVNYDDLKSCREKEQSIYNDITQLDIQDDADSLQDNSDDAATYIKKQKNLIDEARDNFQKAYEQVLTIKKHVRKIEDEKQKEQASDIVTIMKERKDYITSFLDEYEEQLKRLNSFYSQLQEQDNPFRIEKLNEEIHDINNHNDNLEYLIETFNQKTQSYNETKETYYKMAEIN